jgi:bifunctional DNA-binding transcriptional regulator/antitoxin component of YhaV-PrlF toxin-antitoxin module
MTTTLTGKNQVTIPTVVARNLGLIPGAQLDWAVGESPDKIIITIKPSRKQLLEEVRAIGRKLKKTGRDPVSDLIRERVQDDVDKGMMK